MHAAKRSVQNTVLARANPVVHKHASVAGFFKRARMKCRLSANPQIGLPTNVTYIMIAIELCQLTGGARCGDGGFTVKFSWYGRSILVLTLITALLSSCSLDPNVRKQKYFQRGQDYFSKGQYQEAAIEFTNAIKIDGGYADAHFQLA